MSQALALSHLVLEVAAGGMGMALSARSVVQAVEEAVCCELAGEAVIFNPRNGVYYGLDPLGAWIWSLLRKPKRVGEIRDALLTEYEVSPARCQRDLFALMRQLRAHDLVRILR